MSTDLFSADLDLSPWADDFTRAFELFWRTYVDPDTGVVYDLPMSESMQLADDDRRSFKHTDEPFVFPSDYARPDLSAWPTPDEVAASVPTVHGWETAIENGPGEGGPLLAGLARGAFDLTDERRRECIDLVYRGLISLWTVPGRTGFVCRGYLPKSKAFYQQTSFDQLPYYFYGLAEYARSRYCTDAHRHEIAECISSIMQWLEGNGWRLTLYKDTGHTPHSDGRNMDPGHTVKMFVMLLMASQLTGDPRWRDIYLQWRDEDDRKQMRSIERRNKTWEPYMLLYHSLMLKELAELDDDPECRAYYNEQRWLLMHQSTLFCSRHVYAQFQPNLPDQPKSIHTQPDVLTDFRPALTQTIHETSFEPNNSVFWWQYRERYEPYRLQQGALGDGWLTYDYFSITGTHLLIMNDWPDRRPHWGAERARLALEGFYTRLCFDHPLRFLPKLALAVTLG